MGFVGPDGSLTIKGVSLQLEHSEDVEDIQQKTQKDKGERRGKELFISSKFTSLSSTETLGHDTGRTGL